jgi:hypothetical protein
MEEDVVGIFDMLKGRKREVKSGLDQAGKLAADKAPDSVKGHVDKGVDMAKDAVDKLPD